MLYEDQLSVSKYFDLQIEPVVLPTGQVSWSLTFATFKHTLFLLKLWGILNWELDL